MEESGWKAAIRISRPSSKTSSRSSRPKFDLGSSRRPRPGRRRRPRPRRAPTPTGMPWVVSIAVAVRATLLAGLRRAGAHRADPGGPPVLLRTARRQEGAIATSPFCGRRGRIRRVVSTEQWRRRIRREDPSAGRLAPQALQSAVRPWDLAVPLTSKQPEEESRVNAGRASDLGDWVFWFRLIRRQRRRLSVNGCRQTSSWTKPFLRVGGAGAERARALQYPRQWVARDPWRRASLFSPAFKARQRAPPHLRRPPAAARLLRPTRPATSPLVLGRRCSGIPRLRARRRMPPGAGPAPDRA
jgi:hypothetical protein